MTSIFFAMLRREVQEHKVAFIYAPFIVTIVLCFVIASVYFGITDIQTAEFNFSTDYSFNTILNIGNRTKINLFYKHVGKLPSFLEYEGNIVESNTDAYNLLDLSINRRIGNLVSLSFGGKNLLNIIDIKRTNSAASIHSSSTNKLAVGYGRTYFISLNYNL